MRYHIQNLARGIEVINFDIVLIIIVTSELSCVG